MQCCLFRDKIHLIFVFFVYYCDSMDETVDLIFKYGSSWEVLENDELLYFNGSVDFLYDFDLDFLNYGDILYRYYKVLGYANVKKYLFMI